MRRIPYRGAVGALMWAATMTRPDILVAPHNLAKFCDDPEPVYWMVAIKVLRCFWRTKDLSITNGKVKPRIPLIFSIFVFSIFTLYMV